MKAVSAAIVILSGSILLATAGIVRGDERWLLGSLGVALGLWGTVVWYWALALEKPQPPTQRDPDQ